MNYLKITYGNKGLSIDSFTLTFKLRNQTITEKWCDRLILAQQQYSIDDTKRFYGFGFII